MGARSNWACAASRAASVCCTAGYNRARTPPLSRPRECPAVQGHTLAAAPRCGTPPPILVATAGCGHERPERLTGEISVERNFFFGVFSSVFSILVSQVGAAVSSSLRICPADGWIRLIDARFRSLLSFVVRLFLFAVWRVFLTHNLQYCLRKK